MSITDMFFLIDLPQVAILEEEITWSEQHQGTKPKHKNYGGSPLDFGRERIPRLGKESSTRG